MECLICENRIIELKFTMEDYLQLLFCSQGDLFTNENTFLGAINRFLLKELFL